MYRSDTCGIQFCWAILQISIEYGLCEMLNKEAIRGDVAPKDGNWGFNIPELEAKFPESMVDRTVERVYKEVVGKCLGVCIVYRFLQMIIIFG